MKLKFLKFEVRNSETDCWQCVPEIDALEILQTNFERIAPKIDEMLQGYEIDTSVGVFRVILAEKNC